MSKHTPGPWNLASDGCIWAIRDGGPTHLAKCEDLDADAVLMTAAPKLLAMLKEFVQFMPLMANSFQADEVAALEHRAILLIAEAEDES